MAYFSEKAVYFTLEGQPMADTTFEVSKMASDLMSLTPAELELFTAADVTSMTIDEMYMATNETSETSETVNGIASNEACNEVHNSPPIQSALPVTKVVKFLILSDAHGLKITADPTSAFRIPDFKVDVVLYCGNLTNNGGCESLRKALLMLGSIPAELKLAIAGSRDISLDRQFSMLQNKGSEADNAQVLRLMHGTFAQSCGVRFLDEGTHIFFLRNGVKVCVYASPYTPGHGSAAFQCPSDYDRFNPQEATPPWAENVGTTSSIIPECVDIVMTHGPPRYILDMTGGGRIAGCEHLRRAVERVKPRLHCFGHVNHGYGAWRVRYTDEELDVLSKELVSEKQARKNGFAALSPSSVDAFRGDQSQGLMVNAAIKAEKGEPVRAPWLVELEMKARA